MMLLGEIPPSVLMEVCKFLNAFEYCRFESTWRESWCVASDLRGLASSHVFDWFPCVHRVSSYISWLVSRNLHIRSFAIHRHDSGCLCYHSVPALLPSEDLYRLIRLTGASLETLRIKSTASDFNWRNVRQIASVCHNLHTLEVSITDVYRFGRYEKNISNRDLECLARSMPLLRNVEIRNCGHRISGNSAASFLKHCPDLKSLRFLDGFYFVNDYFLGSLVRHEKLQSLYITGELYDLSDEGVATLKHKFPRLEHMFIAYNEFINEMFDDDDDDDNNNNYGGYLFSDHTTDAVKWSVFWSFPHMHVKHFFIGNNEARLNIPLHADELFIDDDPVFVDNPCVCHVRHQHIPPPPSTIPPLTTSRRPSYLPQSYTPYSP